MANTPQIPNIPTMAPTQSAAGGVATPSDIGSLMAPIVAAANQPVPDPYTQGVQVAEPHLKQIVPASQYRDNRPIQGDVQDKNRARRQNSVAGLANMIGNFGQKIQERKQAALKDRLVDVMKYKQNAENAQTVLNDPNASPQAKQMAQKVADANKKQLNDLLSDPKHQKEMAKALDISFVDPDKNKTPEVQAYQQAVKEFKAAGPFTSDNPQEYAVAQAAQGGGQAQSKQPVQTQQSTQPQQQKSQTPYADAALKKDSPTIAQNPQYAAVVQQKQAAQKQLATMIPHLIDTESKAQIQAARDGNAAAREVFKASSDFRAKALDDITKLNIADAKDATTLKTTAMRDAATIASASIRANAAVKVAQVNGLSREQVQNVKQQGATDLDKHINATEQALKTYGQREADIKNSTTMSDTQKKQALDALNYSRQQDTNKLKALQDIRAKNFPDIPPPTTEEAPPKAGEGILGKIFDMLTYPAGSFDSKEKPNADTKPAASSEPANKQQGINLIGNDESDESGNDSSEDSDSY
jgi:hypothetical protein